MSEDKYPSESGRRRFVKGVVGSAALAGVGVGGAATVDLATQPSGGGGGPTPYVGIQLMGGPAPRGMPYIPVQIDDNGDILGLWPEVEEVSEGGQTFEVARTEIGGQTYSSEWFQYCGRQNANGIEPSADQENYFVAADSPDYEWQADEVEGGQPLNIDHFEGYESWGNEIGNAGIGKPAQATWRSEGEGQLPVTVIRSSLIEEKAQEDSRGGKWYSAASVDGVIAYLNVCTHFCCVPGYKLSDDAPNYDAEDGVYCQCHQSRYDPFTPEFGTFVSLPRPDDDSAGGGSGGGGEEGGGGEGGGEEGGGGEGGGEEGGGGEGGGEEGGGGEGGGEEGGGGGGEGGGGDDGEGGDEGGAGGDGDETNGGDGEEA